MNYITNNSCDFYKISQMAIGYQRVLINLNSLWSGSQITDEELGRQTARFKIIGAFLELFGT